MVFGLFGLGLVAGEGVRPIGGVGGRDSRRVSDGRRGPKPDLYRIADGIGGSNITAGGLARSQSSVKSMEEI